jgi:hypothetical protein
VLEATGRLRQLPKIWSEPVLSQGSVCEYTHQLKSVNFRMFLQVLGNVPVRGPGGYDGECDLCLDGGIRHLKDGS